MMAWYKLDAIPIKRRVKFTRTGKPYTDIKTIIDLDMVRDSYKGELLEGAVSLHIIIYRQLPKGKKREEPFTTKPDIDNVIKCVMDGLTGVAFEDDKQVVQIVAQKLTRQATGGEFAMYAVEPATDYTEGGTYGAE